MRHGDPGRIFHRVEGVEWERRIAPRDELPEESVVLPVLGVGHQDEDATRFEDGVEPGEEGSVVRVPMECRVGLDVLS